MNFFKRRKLRKYTKHFLQEARLSRNMRMDRAEPRDLEALAEAVAAAIGARFAPIELVVRVRKPDPPVAAQFDGVEVEIHRTYG